MVHGPGPGSRGKVEGPEIDRSRDQGIVGLVVSGEGLGRVWRMFRESQEYSRDP